MDDVVAQFAEITGAAPDLATQYLQITDYNIEQAMQLFFDQGGAPLAEPTQPSRPHPREDQSGVVHIDSDSDEDTPSGFRSTEPASTFDDDAALARRLQEEAYGMGGGAGNAYGAGNNEDDVRAPMARTTETLVGPDDDYEDEMPANILEHLRGRRSGG